MTIHYFIRRNKLVEQAVDLIAGWAWWMPILQPKPKLAWVAYKAAADPAPAANQRSVRGRPCRASV